MASEQQPSPEQDIADYKRKLKVARGTAAICLGFGVGNGLKAVVEAVNGDWHQAGESAGLGAIFFGKFSNADRYSKRLR